MLMLVAVVATFLLLPLAGVLGCLGYARGAGICVLLFFGGLLAWNLMDVFGIAGPGDERGVTGETRKETVARWENQGWYD